MKILGIGTDLVDISRIEKSYQQYNMNFAKRMLSPVELEKFSDVKHPVHYLAKRFAAKEAIVKALGTGFRDEVMLTGISILNDEQGAPFVEFEGKTKSYIENLGPVTIHISVSDEKNHCLAFAIATN